MMKAKVFKDKSSMMMKNSVTLHQKMKEKWK